MTPLKPILLAEDDTVDTMVVKRAFRYLGVLNTLITKVNGEEVIQYLDSPEMKSPCLIILDINMPKMNGHECLKHIRKNPTYKNIPIFIMSASKEHNDVNQGFEGGITGYILKPVEFEEFLESIKVFNPYWSLQS